MINNNLYHIRDLAIKLNNSMHLTADAYSSLEKEYANFMSEVAKSPTQGYLIKQQYLNIQHKHKGNMYIENLEKIKQSPLINAIKKGIQDKINELYPNTKIVRKYIIQNKRISVEFVKEKKGYNIFDRFIINTQKLKKTLFK